MLCLLRNVLTGVARRGSHCGSRLVFRQEREVLALPGPSVTLDPVSEKPIKKIPANDFGRPIWDIIEEIGAQVPDSEWAKVPQDLATNLDHYLYGAPKQED
jgi:hypothetical protein